MSCSQERRKIIEEFCVYFETPPSLFHVYQGRNFVIKSEKRIKEHATQKTNN